MGKKGFSIFNQLKLVQGVERELLKHKNMSTGGFIIMVLGFICQVLIPIFNEDFFKGDWISNAGKFPFYQLWGMVIVGIGLLTFLLFKRTRLLLKESEEPFHYTFWIEPFQRAKETSGDPFAIDSDDRFHNRDSRFFSLLHHDLVERLNERIKRLSLLDIALLKDSYDGIQGKLTSHIHVAGHYTIRRQKGEIDTIIIQVMPRVRIGPAYMPVTLANTIKYRIKTEKKDNEHGKFELTTNIYEQILEHVYSSVATEIYKQIEADLEKKLKLFPTSYTRAAALYHEARDFARSNTLDAYERAIVLYKKALRYFDISVIKCITNWFISIPFLWRLKMKLVHLYARIQIGYAQALIYRREISSFSRRRMNPVFEVPDKINELIIMLMKLHNRINRKWKLDIHGLRSSLLQEEKSIADEDRKNATLAFLCFPKDSFLRHKLFRPLEPLFEKQRRILFDAFTVCALAYYFLNAFYRAEQYLENAKTVDPLQSEKNPLYIFTKGAIEADIDKKILMFRNAVEIAPDFQIAQFFLAYYSEMQFRRNGELNSDRAESVLNAYDEVLKINPGNIAALAAQGYIYWLLAGENKENSDKKKKFLEKAKEKFLEGCEVKAVVRETYIGELNYGLARIAAEDGEFNKSYDYYTQALSADPGVGAYSPPNIGKTQTHYYDFITPKMLERFENFKTGFEIQMLLFGAGDFKNLGELLKKIKEKHTNLAKHILSLISEEVKEWLEDDDSDFSSQELRKYFIIDLNRIIQSKEFDYKTAEIKMDARDLQKIEDNFGEGELYNVFINRWVLEKHFPGEILDCFNSWIDTKPDKYNQEDQICSRKAKWRLHSYILNDYGNACLNYSRRFGSLIQLEKTIQVLKNAADKNSENLIAFYNLHKALEWRGGKDDTDEKILDLLDKAEKLAFAWPEILFASAQLRLKFGKEKIEEELRNQRKHKKMPGEIDNEASEDESNGEKNESKGPTGIKNPSPKVKNARKCIESVSEIIKETRLSSLIRKDFDLNEKEITSLIKQIKLDRLDENDVLALKICAEVLSINPKKNASFLLAEKLFEYILEKYYPDNFDVNKILLEKYKERNDEKVKKCDKTIHADIRYWHEQDPLDYYILFLASEFYETSGDSIAILNDIINDEKVKDRPEYHYLLGKIFHKNNEYEKAAVEYKKAVKLNSKEALYHAKLVLVYSQSQNKNEMDKAYKNAIEADNKDPVYQNKLGYLFQKYRDCRKSIKPYINAARLNPKNAAYFADLAYAYGILRKWEKAQKAYLKASELDPSKSLYWANLGFVYMAQKKWEDAKNAYLEAIKVDPEESQYHYKLAEIYLENLDKHDYWEAVKEYRQAIEYDPGETTYYAGLASVYSRLKNEEEAKKVYKTALAVDPVNSRYLHELGDAFYQYGDYEKSIELFEKASQLDPSEVSHFASLGDAYMELEKNKEAQEAYLKASKLNPDEATYFDNLGWLYMVTKKFKKAKKAYLKASELDPQEVVYFEHLGHICMELNQLHEANAAYLETTRLEPQEAAHFADLGEVYLVSQNLKEAEKAYLKANELDPEEGEYYDILIKIYNSNHEYENAAKYALKAVQIFPDWSDPNYIRILIDACKKIENRGIAKSFLQEALESDPENQWIIKAIKSFK